MFYVTAHSRHFIYGYYGVGHMVEDHFNNEKRNHVVAIFMSYSFTLAARDPPYHGRKLYHGLMDGWMDGWKEGNVLFNDALNTFFNLRLYGVRHMVKDHSEDQ